MPNPNTPNESESKCSCPVCVALPDLARAAGCVPLSPLSEAAARAPKVADYVRRPCDSPEADAIREIVRDCVVACIASLYPRMRSEHFREVIDRAAARAISYDRAEHSPADILCASTDRRDDNEDAAAAVSEKEYRADEDLAAAREAFARAGRYADNADKAIRAAAEVQREDTDTGPAGAD